jgi:hypothetical protein
LPRETLRVGDGDVLEALGDYYKCDAGMSVENVPAIVNVKTLKGRFTAHKFSTGWSVGVVNKEDYGVDKYWVRVNTVEKH